MTLRNVALGSLAILAVAYGVAPWLAERLLPPLLARWGVESSQFSFGYPRWNGVDVKALSLATADTTVAGHDVRISYRLTRLLRGEVEAVDIADLTVRLGRSTATPDASGSFDIASFWTLIPARRVVVRKLDVTNAEPAVAALGTVNFDPEVLQVKLGVESPLLAVPLDVDGAVNPDGRVALTLTERGSTVPLGSLTGVPDRDGHAMAVDGRIALTGRPLASGRCLCRCDGVERQRGNKCERTHRLAATAGGRVEGVRRKGHVQVRTRRRRAARQRSRCTNVRRLHDCQR